MSLRLYRGSLESDMTEKCLNEIERDKASRHLIIVPDNYSYETERAAAERFGVIGLNNTEVLTPHRMAINYLNTDEENYLNPAGKQMLAVCAIDMCMEDADVGAEVKAIISRRSFAASIVTLISEFKRHMITPEFLRMCADDRSRKNSGAGYEHLTQKFMAVSGVYDRYNTLIGEKNYIDSDDDVARLAAKIEAESIEAERTRPMYAELASLKEELVKTVSKIKTVYETYNIGGESENEREEILKEISDKERDIKESEDKKAELANITPADAQEKKEISSKKSKLTRAVNSLKKSRVELLERLKEADEKRNEIKRLTGESFKREREIRKRIEEISAKEVLGRKKLLVDANTRVWFMSVDEYFPNYIRLISAAHKNSKETTVCLNYVKADDKYEITDDDIRYRELERYFGSEFSENDRTQIRETIRGIYEKYGVYYDENDTRPENNISRDAVIYAAMQKSYNRLIRLNPDSEKFFSKSGKIKRVPEMNFLIKHYGMLDKFNGECKNIRIAECENPHREIEYAAEMIHTLTRESEIKYKNAVKRLEKGENTFGESAYERDMREAKTEAAAFLREKLNDDKDAEKLAEWAGIGDPRLPEEGDVLRYRDIGMVFGGASDYTHILDAVFAEHNIKYFSDEKIILSEHPIAVQLLSVFDIYESDWSYEAMFRYLNAGFVFEENDADGAPVRLDTGEIARLDNYVVRYDIRGRAAWSRHWDFYGEIFEMTWGDEKTRDEDREENEKVNELREKTVMPLLKLLPMSRQEKKKTSEYVEAMYEFLRDIKMYEGLAADVEYFENDKNSPSSVQTAQQFSQIWNKLLEIMNQINVTMGDREITFSRFGEYLRAGLSQCKISTIPSSLDAVYTGCADGSTPRIMKKLFVMGAVSGTYPSQVSYDGFFSDIERGYIRDFGGGEAELAPTRAEQRINQRYNVFKALRSASRGMIISFPLKDNDGNDVRPSSFIADMSDMFGIIKHSAFPESETDERNITSEYAAKRGLVINSAAAVNRLSPAWKNVYRYFKNSGKHYKTLEQISLASSFYAHMPRILPETAQELYTREIIGNSPMANKGRIYSATALDVYAACPMKYFMQYGLRLAEEEKEGVRPNEVGTYVHKLVKTVCEDVYTPDTHLSNEENEKRCLKAWHELDEKKLREYIAANITNTEDRLSDAVPDYHMRRRIMGRIKDTVSKSAVNILESLKQGDFVLKAAEMPIRNVRLWQDEDIYINGAIDRVDEFKYRNGDERENILRIIDYKTGSTSFNAADIKNGRNMQLAIYAVAALVQYESESGIKHSLSGLYYQHIRDRYSSVKREDDSFSAMKKEIYLDGETYLPPKDGTEKERAKREKILEAMPKSENYIKSVNRSKSESDRDELLNAVKNNIKGIDKEIMSGKILPEPYGDGRENTECSICRFKDICSFEKNKFIRYKNNGGANFGGEENNG